MSGKELKKQDHSCVEEETMPRQSVDHGTLEQHHAESMSYSAAAERRLVRKIDFT